MKERKQSREFKRFFNGSELINTKVKYITEEELNAKGYITEIPDIYAKVEYVDEKLGNIETILSTLTTVTEEV